MNKHILLQYIYQYIYMYTYTYVHVFVYAFICEFRCIHVFLSSWITSRQNVAQLSGTLRTGRRTRPTPTDCIRRLDWGWRLQRTWSKTMGLSENEVYPQRFSWIWLLIVDLGYPIFIGVSKNGMMQDKKWSARSNNHQDRNKKPVQWKESLRTSLPVGPPWNLTKKSSGMYNLTVSGDGSNATGHRFHVKRLQHIWIKGHRKHPKIFPYSWWYNDILLCSFYS